MQIKRGLSLEEIQAFLKASGEIHFEGQSREEVYGWVNGTLRQQNYGGLSRSGRGLVRGYMEKMTGLSRAQVTRLITQYQPIDGGDFRRSTRGRTRNCWPRWTRRTRR